MPSGGHNRLPDAVKAARGTLQPFRVNPSAPLPKPVESLPCPSGLGAVGRKCWRTLSGEMSRMGYLTSAYAYELEMAAFWYERWKAIRKKMQGSGDTDRELSRQVLEVGRELAARLSKLGMNPSDVGRIRAQKVEGEDEEMKRLLGVTN